MKKLFLFLISLLFSIPFSGASSPASTGQRPINVICKKKNNSNTTNIPRTPMMVAIDVNIDDENGLLYVENARQYEGESMIYSETGVLMDYSTSIESVFDISGYPEGWYSIIIDTESWTATGYFEID